MNTNNTIKVIQTEQISQARRRFKLETLVYSLIAISLIIRVFSLGSNNLLVEEAYYWNYTLHLDWGYVDHPPMVAVLIKLFTTLFGINEFGVRIPSVLCWLGAAFFSYKLTNLIARGTGIYAVMLLAVLPYFFLHSLVITPDQPLIVCWSAALYYLYRSLVLNESRCWYKAGFWLGLGMLSKYSIVLLGPAAILYMCMVADARSWFARKEPYFCLLIVALLFTPVIYWNATHEWVSFLFQSTRRIKFTYSCSLHKLFGLLIFFLMPPGVLGLWKLFTKNSHKTVNLELKTKRFFQLFALVPFSVFAVFSLNHGIKFNWIGPPLLAVIPWLAILINDAYLKHKHHFINSWLVTSWILLFCYSCLLLSLCFGIPEIAHKTVLRKFIAWDDLTQQFNKLASQIEIETNSSPIFVPVDLYNISSELGFYQAKLLSRGEIQKTYPVIGRHIFGDDSLMYRYWSKDIPIEGKTLILISAEPHYFDKPELKKLTIEKSPVQTLWSHSQGRGDPIDPYYYRIVQVPTLPSSRTP